MFLLKNLATTDEGLHTGDRRVYGTMGVIARPVGGSLNVSKWDGRGLCIEFEG